MKLMENKQTAIEWLVEKTTESGHLWLTDKPYSMDELSLIIEQAKAMEKEQIKDAWLSAWKDSMLDPLENKFYEPEAEQYYNEYYGK